MPVTARGLVPPRRGFGFGFLVFGHQFNTCIILQPYNPALECLGREVLEPCRVESSIYQATKIARESIYSNELESVVSNVL